MLGAAVYGYVFPSALAVRSDAGDRQFAANWGRGAYHFYALCTDGRTRAAHFLAVARPDQQALASAVDL